MLVHAIYPNFTISKKYFWIEGLLAITALALLIICQKKLIQFSADCHKAILYSSVTALASIAFYEMVLAIYVRQQLVPPTSSTTSSPAPATTATAEAAPPAPSPAAIVATGVPTAEPPPIFSPTAAAIAAATVSPPPPPRAISVAAAAAAAAVVPASSSVALLGARIGDPILVRGMRERDAEEILVALERCAPADIEPLMKLLEGCAQSALETFFKHPQFNIYIFKAMELRRISPTQAATFFYLYSTYHFYQPAALRDLATKLKVILTPPRLELHCLYSNGKVDARSRDLLRETLVFSEPPEFEGAVTNSLTSKGFDALLKEIAPLPPSEQMFYVLPNIFPEDTELLFKFFKKILRFFTSRAGLVIVPSFGIMQALLNVSFQENAPRILPTLGITTPDEMALDYIDRNGRILAIVHPTYSHFPLNEARVLEADGVPAPGHHFSYHDLYHLCLIGMIFRMHRVVFARLGLGLGRACKGRFLLIDMPFGGYRNYPPIEAFWRSIDRALNDLSFRDDPAKIRLFTKIFEIIFSCKEAQDADLTLESLIADGRLSESSNLKNALPYAHSVMDRRAALAAPHALAS